MRAPGGGRIGPFLQPTQGGGTGDFTLYVNGCLYNHIAAQCAVVVEVLSAQCQAIDTLAQQLGHAVGDQQRVARVSDSTSCSFYQTELALSGTQPDDTSIAGHAGAIKLALNHTSTQTTKVNLVVCSFLCTVWHW